MNAILFDDSVRTELLPLTYTRPVAEIRWGILTFSERWNRLFQGNVSHATAAYLSTKYPVEAKEDNLLINGALVGTPELAKRMEELKEGEALKANDRLLAVKVSAEAVRNWSWESTPWEQWLEGAQELDIEVTILEHWWDIFAENGAVLASDFELLTAGRESGVLEENNTLIGPRDQLFLEEGARVQGATLNTSNGPIYIGRNAEVMEGSLIRGGFALYDHGVVKMAGKIYGPTTVGPHCKVGGEVNNCVIIGYSNKGHDGFIGNSVIGEWCNLGADTNTSNLKNNYGPVKVWNYDKQRFVSTERQFCGLLMGDHSKSAINTMFNTGTVVGVSCNIYGGGFPRTYIPSFSWGGPAGLTTFSLNKACEVGTRMMERRNLAFDDTEHAILEHVFENTATFRG